MARCKDTFRDKNYAIIIGRTNFQIFTSPYLGNGGQQTTNDKCSSWVEVSVTVLIVD
jgi:hypothetical protein